MLMFKNIKLNLEYNPKLIPIMINKTKGTNSYLTRITKKIPQITILRFIFPGFLCILELAKGRIMN